MEKKYFLPDNIKHFPSILLIGIFFLLAAFGARSFSADKALFKSNFSDLKENWEVWDDPAASGAQKSSQWRAGLAELSGISNKDKKVATILLAGEPSWQNYAVETTLLNDRSGGYLTGVIFGYQDPEHFYHAGYNLELNRFEVEARTPEGFILLASYKIKYPAKEAIPLSLEFAGNRIRLTANHKSVIDIVDGRYRNGRFGLGTSNLGNGRVLFGPVAVKSIAPASLLAPEMKDLLAGSRGAKVITEAFTKDFSRLIDHEGTLVGAEKPDLSSMNLNLSKETLPIEAVFAFPQEKEVEIHKIELQLTPSKFPGQVEILVSGEPDGSFESIGMLDVKPEKNSTQEIPVNPTKAKFLKLRIHSLTEPTNKTLGIMELYVYGFDPDQQGMSPSASTGIEPGKVLFQDDFSSGLTDRWEVWDDASASPQKSKWDIVLTEYSGIRNKLRVPASLLTAGEKTWTNYSVRSHLYIESSPGNLTGLVFGHRDSEHYYIVGYNLKNGYELRAKTPIGFETLAFARMNIPRNQFVPIQVDFLEKRMLFKAGGEILFDLDNQLYPSGKVGVGTSNLGRGAVMFKGLEVTQLDPQTLRSRDLQDLLAGNRGATVIYRPSIPKGNHFAEAIDHSLENDRDMGNRYNLDLAKSPLPEEAVFCFPQERFVEIHRIGVKLGNSSFPKEIKFWVTDQTPKTGFVPLTTITLEPEKDSYQEFNVNPTRAKYLKIQITSSHDPKSIHILDIFVKGYFMEKASHRAEREAFEDTKLQEKEGNNSPAAAQALPLEQALKGEVAREDVDYYKISLKGHSGNTLNLRIDSADIIRPEYELQTPEGDAVKPSHVSNAGTWMKVSYQLQSSDYYLKIWRPDAFLSIVYDDSGSMKRNVKTVKRVLTGYLDRLGEGLNLRLLKYTGEPKFLSEFTNNPDELKEALVKQVKGGGGTDTFKGLSAAVGSLKAQPGSRAVLAIFDVIDCSGSDCLQKYLRLWDAILDDAVSFNVIALSPEWDKNTPYFNNTREQIFKEIAYASRGQFYHSPFDEQIAESSDQIFKQLTSPSIYRIEAEWIQTETKPGSIEVLFEEGAEKQAAKNVELILDASNSMWGQIQGEAKITIAKEVLNQIIDGLPDEMNVGLRMYGHRYKLNDSKACQDTELVAPIGPIDKTRLNAEVDKVTPRGKTPLVHSVLEGIKDFKDIKGGMIVLISDGIESCDGDIDSIAPAVQDAGLELKVNIIGFDIKDAEAREQLEAIAASTGGAYLDARDSDQLLSSLEQTLKVEFVLLDAEGNIKVKGTVGGKPVEILEGTYTLRLLVDPEPIEMEVSVRPDQTLQLHLKKDNQTWKIQEK